MPHVLWLHGCLQTHTHTHTGLEEPLSLVCHTVSIVSMLPYAHVIGRQLQEKRGEGLKEEERLEIGEVREGRD